MARQSYLLLSSTVGQVNIVGEQVKAAGYYGSSNGKHTVAIYNKNFTGRLSIQATLALEPSDNDWFAVSLGGDLEVEYTDQDSITTFNFTGNYVWLRAVVDRSYLPAPEDPHGSIDKIYLNF